MGAPLFATISQAERKFIHFPVLNGEPIRFLPPPPLLSFSQPPLVFRPSVPFSSLLSQVPSSSFIPPRPELPSSISPTPNSSPPFFSTSSFFSSPPSPLSPAPSHAPGAALRVSEEHTVPHSQIFSQEERSSSSEDNTIEVSLGETSDESVPSTPRDLSPSLELNSRDKRQNATGKFPPLKRCQEKEKRRRKIFEPVIRSNHDLKEIMRASENVTERIFPEDQQIFKTEVVLYRGHIIASVNIRVTVNKPKITDGSKRATTQHNDCLRNLGFSEKRLAKREKDGLTYFIKKMDAGDIQKLRLCS